MHDIYVNMHVTIFVENQILIFGNLQDYETHEGRWEFIKISKPIELCYLFSRESVLTD